MEIIHSNQCMNYEADAANINEYLSIEINH